MDKKEVLDGMSIKELQSAIWAKQEQEAIAKFGAKREVVCNIKEVDTLEAEGDGNLFHVRIEDGCEGWEAIVEIERNALREWNGDMEEFVENHILNFTLDNDYYEEGDIEEIKVEEICRYSRPFFKIQK